MPQFVPPSSQTPLAVALRPQTLNDIIGQEHLLGPGKPLRQMADKKRYQSTIFWGPPGTGKTTIVRALAKQTGSHFQQLNATNTTVKELRSVITKAQDALRGPAPVPTFVFIDEVHRWSTSQQDVLLPVVEDGTIIFFGATTEKPKFAVNSTIISRCLVYEVKPLDNKAMVALIIKIKEHYKSSGKIVKIGRMAAETLINRCSGDARKLITAMETAVEILSDDGNIASEHIDAAIPDKHLVFDAKGNEHFDLAHCYQESIQHSDVNSAIYWLAKWIESGEDPAYISRRMLITAFEDCAGNPFAMTTAVAACYAVERTGLPECMIPLAQATCEMAMSKRNKSSYYAIKAALEDIRNGETVHVPPELRAGTRGYTSVNKEYLGEWKRDTDEEN